MKAGDIVTCNSCGGTYMPLQRDGTEYYHACPLRRVVGSKPAPTKDDPDATAPVYAAIAEPRNENVKSVDEKGVVTIVAEGKGVAAVVDQAAIAAFANPVTEEA